MPMGYRTDAYLSTCSQYCSSLCLLYRLFSFGVKAEKIQGATSCNLAWIDGKRNFPSGRMIQETMTKALELSYKKADPGLLGDQMLPAVGPIKGSTMY